MAGARQNYSGTRLESIFWFFCVFTCIYLDYIGQNWLKFGDKLQIPSMITIIPKKWSAIMGRNGRDVLGHTSKWCLGHIFSRSAIHHTPSV